MIDIKHLAISVVVILCLTVAVFLNTTSSLRQTRNITQAGEPEYDPWADLDGDGNINIVDIANVAVGFGTSGDPTRKVNVINSYYEWYGGEEIEPGHGWGFENETAGYGQVHIRMNSNVTVNVYVSFGILVPGEPTDVLFLTFQDQFEITTPWEKIYKTYDVKGSNFQVAFLNPSDTTAARVFMAMYMTT